MDSLQVSCWKVAWPCILCWQSLCLRTFCPDLDKDWITLKCDRTALCLKSRWIFYLTCFVIVLNLLVKLFSYWNRFSNRNILFLSWGWWIWWIEATVLAVQAKTGEISISCFGSDDENRRSNVSDLPLLYLFSVVDGIIIARKTMMAIVSLTLWWKWSYLRCWWLRWW